MSKWISTKERVPDGMDSVLVVKRLKSGQRTIGMGYCIKDYSYKDYSTNEIIRKPRWVCAGTGSVIYWMPLPAMPKEDDDAID